ncbi:MAG: hypothetical protein J6O56_05715 [Bacilli bacterium]|nr:hypothetical protein [Bacilli bacterium]
MKRILSVVVGILSIVLLTGCTKNYKAITYTRFNEIFKNKKDYLIINQTLKYEDKFERCLEANGENIQFLYYEFKTEKQARKYIADNYKGRDKYRFKDRKKYIIVKCTDSMYFYAIQIDKTVIVGNSPDKGNKRIIKKIFKEFGY